MDGYRLKNRRRRHNERGFTLIELVLVATLIAILSTLAMASMSQARLKTYETGAADGLKALVAAQEMFFIDNGRYAYGFSALATTYLPRSYSANAWRGVFIKNYSLRWLRGRGGSPRPPIANYSTHSYTIFAMPIDRRLKTFVITDDGAVNVASSLVQWSPY